MTTQRKSEASRRNGSLSMGPKTKVGLARSSKNAVKHSLYTDAVVPALGESAKQYEGFRLAVREQLQTRGPVEDALAARVALVFWKFDRLTRYETAATRTAAAAELPPDPDTITGLEVDPRLEVPPGAAPADRLAYLRNRAQPRADELVGLRLATRLLDGEDGDASAVQPAWLAVVRELGSALGCSAEEALERLRESAETLQRSPGEVTTGADLRNWLEAVADDDGFDPTTVTRSIRDGLLTRAAALEQTIARSRNEEERLVERLRLARESAAATMAFGDDAALDRVMRVEAHLTRQLDATLTLLARVRGEGASRVVGGLGMLVREVAARVTGIAAGEPAALPEAVGSFRNGEVSEAVHQE